ncbi:MAG: hypothetical protein CEN89_31 [Candidatus Berkelbacteria bacterium Licking1014_7]|uniref:Uncharacterized protein n=1 Tax=Candidatus Berkelbacteria bacterium Licking1014_7 TaxID=2017147 RepID=A0A554LKZ8_9BACT|nr:MAG: hypothetical protein CEN89_31 [Candidatus Berkelbacteria bacterium Licking1014_7]
MLWFRRSSSEQESVPEPTVEEKNEQARQKITEIIVNTELDQTEKTKQIVFETLKIGETGAESLDNYLESQLCAKLNTEAGVPNVELQSQVNKKLVKFRNKMLWTGAGMTVGAAIGITLTGGWGMVPIGVKGMAFLFTWAGSGGGRILAELARHPFEKKRREAIARDIGDYYQIIQEYIGESEEDKSNPNVIIDGIIGELQSREERRNRWNLAIDYQRSQKLFNGLEEVMAGAGGFLAGNWEIARKIPEVAKAIASKGVSLDLDGDGVRHVVKKVGDAFYSLYKNMNDREYLAKYFAEKIKHLNPKAEHIQAWLQNSLTVEKIGEKYGHKLEIPGKLVGALIKSKTTSQATQYLMGQLWGMVAGAGFGSIVNLAPDYIKSEKSAQTETPAVAESATSRASLGQASAPAESEANSERSEQPVASTPEGTTNQTPSEPPVSSELSIAEKVQNVLTKAQEIAESGDKSKIPGLLDLARSIVGGQSGADSDAGESPKTNWLEIQNKIQPRARLNAKKDGDMKEYWVIFNKHYPDDFKESIIIESSNFNDKGGITSVEYYDTTDTNKERKITISDDTNEGNIKLLCFLILYS